MRKIIAVLSLTLLATGCWDRIELDQRAIIVAAAIDRAKNQFELTLQTVNTKQNSGAGEKSSGDSQFNLSSAKGISLFEAARNITLRRARRNYWPHTQVVIISKDIAKKQLIPVVDFMARDAERRTTAFLVVSDSKAKDILSSKSEKLQVSGTELIELIDQSETTGCGITYPLREFMKLANSPGKVSYLSCFKLQEGKPVLFGSGLCYDYKLIDLLSPQDTRAINWLSDRLKQTVLTVETQNGQPVTVEINHSQVTYEPKVQGHKLRLKIAVYAQGEIVEVKEKTDLSNISLQHLNSQVDKEISKQLLAVYRKAKDRYRLDLFNLAPQFAGLYPESMTMAAKEWHQLFTNNLELTIDVDCNISFTGTRINTIQ